MIVLGPRGPAQRGVMLGLSRTGQHDAKSALLHRFQQRRSRGERSDLPDQPIEFLDPGVAERVTVLALDVVAGDVPNVFGATHPDAAVQLP